MEPLAHVTFGDGPPLVVLHGLGGSKRIVQRIIGPLLSEEFRVIGIDLPGHGDSPALAWKKTKTVIPDIADAVVEALNELGVERFALVGFSLGGTVALEIASRYPDRITALVLQGSPYWGKEFPLPQRFGMRVLHRLTQAFRNTRRMQRFIAKLHGLISAHSRENPRDDLWRIFWADRYDADRLWWFACSAAILRHDGRSRIKKLPSTLPVLLVDGAQSRVFPIATTYRLKALLPQALVILVPEAGHYLPMQKPEELAGHIRHFLTQESTK